jgi:hypothetical protein
MVKKDPLAAAAPALLLLAATALDRINRDRMRWALLDCAWCRMIQDWMRRLYGDMVRGKDNSRSGDGNLDGAEEEEEEAVQRETRRQQRSVMTVDGAIRLLL